MSVKYLKSEYIMINQDSMMDGTWLPFRLKILIKLLVMTVCFIHGSILGRLLRIVPSIQNKVGFSDASYVPSIRESMNLEFELVAAFMLSAASI